jgi:hypothetical protein
MDDPTTGLGLGNPPSATHIVEADYLKDFVTGTGDKIVVQTNDGSTLLQDFNNLTVIGTGKVGDFKSVASTDNDAYFETSLVMGLGTDNKVGISLDGAGQVIESSRDQILTLETNAALVSTDFILQINQSTGGKMQDLTNNAASSNEILYSSQDQSTATAFDTFTAFDFTEDKLNFQGLHLDMSKYDYDAVKSTANPNPVADGVQLNEILRVDVVTSTSAAPNNNFAGDLDSDANLTTGNNNNGNVLFVLQAVSNPNPGAAPGAYRLFVDVNEDGLFNSQNDMVIDFTSEVNSNAVPTVEQVIGLVGTQGLQFTTVPTGVHPTVAGLFVV